MSPRLPPTRQQIVMAWTQFWIGIAAAIAVAPVVNVLLVAHAQSDPDRGDFHIWMIILIVIDVCLVAFYVWLVRVVGRQLRRARHARVQRP